MYKKQLLINAISIKSVLASKQLYYLKEESTNRIINTISN